MKRTVTCAMFFACAVVPAATAQSILPPPPTSTSMSVFEKVTLPETSLSSPALRLLKNKLFIAWRGLNDQLNVMSSDDGTSFLPATKRLLPAYSYSAPALAAFQGRLFIAWREMLDNRLSIAWRTDGGTWVILAAAGIPGKVTLPDTSFDSPALAADHVQGKLYLCWTGTDRRPYCRWSTNGIDFPAANKVMLDELSNVGPAAVVGCDSLYVAWTGTDYRLNLMSSADGVNFGNKQTLSEYTYARPALHFIHNNHSPLSRIHLFWTGMSDSRIAVRGPNAQGRELLQKFTLNEMSSVAPALESRRQCPVEGSFIGWTGTDYHLNVAKIHATDWK